MLLDARRDAINRVSTNRPARSASQGAQIKKEAINNQ